MTNHDFLGRALGELAAEAPVELRRSEQVWARYRRTRRRTVAVTTGAAVAAVSLLLLLAPPGAERHGLVTHPSATPVPSTSTPPGRPREPAHETAGPQRSDAVGTPVVTRTAGPVVAPPPPPAGEPPAAAFAYMTAHANPGDMVFGEVHPVAWDNGVESYTVDWGDGSAPETTRVAWCPPSTGGRRNLSHQGYPLAHSYTGHGDYGVTVTVRLAGCGRPPQTRTATTRVRIDSAPVGLTGPAGPQVTVERAEPAGGQPHTGALRVSVADADSYVAFLLVEWGDGTATLLRGTVPAWCSGSPSALDSGFPAHVEHAYPTAGTWETQTYVRTATCDGGPGEGTGSTYPLEV